MLGRHFKIRADHQSLKFLLQQRISTPRQQKWMAKLMGYNFEIIYKKGADNIAADALSRIPICWAISTVKSEIWELIHKSWQEDFELANLILQLQQHQKPRPHYEWEHGQLKRKGRLVVGNSQSVR